MDTLTTLSSPETLSLSDITARARSCTDFDGHERITKVIDRNAGLSAIIAIHNRTLGPAIGGCRMWPYADEAEALTDVLRLSRGMTFKCAMAGVALGGGKSVIIGDARKDKSEALFRAFGRAVDSFGGGYISGEDVGVSVQDMNWAAEETRSVLGSGDRGGDPSPFTAHGVHVGLKAAIRHRLGRETLAGVVVAVQGLGHVGQNLCASLAAEGAALIVTDIDPGMTARIAADLGAAVVEPEAIYDAAADVFAPCALGAVINDRTAGRIKASIVAGAANNQLLEDRHGAMLRDRGILYAPDYVINGGGLIALALQITPQGFTPERALAETAGIGGTLAEVFTRADAERAATSVIADRIAMERVDRIARQRA